MARSDAFLDSVRAGQLRDRVTVQTATETRAANGQVVYAWTDNGEEWADVKFLSGLETIAANMQVSDTRCSVRLRYRDGITSANRIIFETQIYDVLSVLLVKSRGYADLVCVLKV